MSDYRTYGQRSVDAVLSAPAARDLTPAEVEHVKAWGSAQDDQDATLVRRWAAEQSQWASEDFEQCRKFADESHDAMNDIQARANERLINPSEGLSALNDARERLDHVRWLRQRVQDQMDRATYLNEQPHEFLDEMWKKFPAMGERPTPPYWHIARRIQ